MKIVFWKVHCFLFFSLRQLVKLRLWPALTPGWRWAPPASAHVAQCSMRAAFMLCLVDCDRPADRTEDPDSHRSGHLWIPQAAVHLDQPRWSWNWEGDPGFPRDIQCQAAHIHHLGQPRPWQDPGKAWWQSIHLRISATELVPDCNLYSALEAKSVSKRCFEDWQTWQVAALAKVKNQQMNGKPSRQPTTVLRWDGS